MALDKIRDPEPADQDKAPEKLDDLATWVMAKVNKWREHRDTNYQKKWAEYYRLWRGFWDTTDQNRDSERSRLIAPALQQAIDMTVSEMEEATFGRSVWFDVSDDYSDEQKDDVIHDRDQLLCDFEEDGVPAAVSEAFLNGALYGTGIGKIQIGKKKSLDVKMDDNGEATASDEEEFRVWMEPVSPMNFVIDPGARSIEEALGCAHEISIPRHKITAKQDAGFYYSDYVGPWAGQSVGINEQGNYLTTDADKSDVVYITEYHGLVPKRLLDGDDEDQRRLPAQEVADDGPVVEDDGELVEAIVTVANKGVLLRAVKNPYLMNDRAFIAYPHDTVPGRFWGRGVSEKGYNPQKALDAELRARIDALAYLTYPTLGADATRLPRGLDLKIKPGRLFLTNGRPSEILEPIVFGNLNPATFQQSGDLERMVQMGTGAMDSASPLESNRRNETASGMSMIQGGFIKRSKRTMQNVERKFLDKLVQKSLWRYMQFAPERYPRDLKFQVNATMGIMAREFEQGVLTQMLQTMPPESPLYPLIIKGIIDNSAASNKSDLAQAVEKMMKPDPQQQAMQQKAQELEFQLKQMEVQKLQAEAQLAQAQGQKALAEANLAAVKAGLEDELVEIQAAQTVVSHNKNEIQKEGLQVQREKVAVDKIKAKKPKPKSK